MSTINTVENTLDQYRVFEVLDDIANLDAFLNGNELSMTSNINGINPDGVEGVAIQAAVSGVNGIHLVDLSGGTFVVDDLYTLVIDYSELDLGQTIPYKYTFTASSTTPATVVTELVAQIQADSRYSSAPFTVADAGGAVMNVTDAPKGDLIAGEVQVKEIVTSVPGESITLNDTGFVRAFGQPAQLQRQKDRAGNSQYPSVAPFINFLGDVDSGTTYTTITLTYRLNQKVSNPVSDAGRILYQDVLYVDEALADLAYVTGIANQFAAKLTDAVGAAAVIVARDAVQDNGLLLVPGVTEVDVITTPSSGDIYISDDYPVGTVLFIDNNGANTLTVNTIASATKIDGSDTDTLATTVDVMYKKATATSWITVFGG